MKLKAQFIILLSMGFLIQTEAQIFHESTFFAVSKTSTNQENNLNTTSNLNNQNTLHQYTAATNQWHLIGSTGTTNIDAIAMDNIGKILYAINGGVLGEINTKTGEFTAIGLANYGNGTEGRLLLNNIDGLTYCPLSSTLYASHHIIGVYAGSNDLLFKIDPSNGEIMRNAMIDENGNNADYAVVEAVKHNACCELYDVSDMAFHPYTHQLYAIQSNKDNNDILTIIDPATGQINSIIFELSDYDSKGLSFTNFGELFGSSTTANNFQIINTDYQFVQALSTFDASQQHTQFHSIAYAGPYHDLALKISLHEDEQAPFVKDEMLTCSITIYNQGEIEVNEIELVNYLVDGLSVADSTWHFENDGKKFAKKIIYTKLVPGDSLTTQIKLKVDKTEPGMLMNSTEILSAKNSNLLDLEYKVLALRDIDSAYDESMENEAPIIDNEIYQSGQKVNEDKDDHDIVIIEVNEFKTNCINDLDLMGSLLSTGTYQATEKITANTLVNEGQKVSLKAGDCISLLTNFEVERGGNLEADITSCE